MDLRTILWTCLNLLIKLESSKPRIVLSTFAIRLFRLCRNRIALLSSLFLSDCMVTIPGEMETKIFLPKKLQQQCQTRHCRQHMVEKSRNLRGRLSWLNFKRLYSPVSSRGTLSGLLSRWEKWLASLIWGLHRSTNGTGTARERESMWRRALQNACATIALKWRRMRKKMALWSPPLHPHLKTVKRSMIKACAAPHYTNLVKRRLVTKMTLSSLRSKETLEEW